MSEKDKQNLKKQRKNYREVKITLFSVMFSIQDE